MPSSSLFLRSSTTLVSALAFASSAFAAPTSSTASSSQVYNLDTDFFSGNFYDNFNFFSSADPTHGFVSYVDETTAANYGSQNNGVPLIQGGSGTNARLNVDSTNQFDNTQAYYGVNGVGRPSVRIESKLSWTHGLIVGNFAHMPFACGAWPAFWTLGSGDWPTTGEVDIIEGWNDQTTDFASFHVNNQCTVSDSSRMTGSISDTNCNYQDPFPNYTGCKVVDQDTSSYGAGFNNNGGGAYAMEWTSDFIKIWFFPSGDSRISNALGDHPTPDNWGTPMTYLGNSCNIDQNFQSHRIIFDTTFCGDAAGPNFGTCANSLGIPFGSGTSNADANAACASYVAKNPSAFANAYWDIKGLKVYKKGSTTTTTTTVSFSYVEQNLRLTILDHNHNYYFHHYLHHNNHHHYD